jgi:CrcB protein
MVQTLMVAALGLLGVLCRYGLDTSLKDLSFPWSTLIANLSGAFLAGVIYAYASTRGISQSLQLGLLVGFCGGYTTFSAMTLQSLQLIEKGRIELAMLYLLGSPLLGLAMVALPVLLVKRFL